MVNRQPIFLIACLGLMAAALQCRPIGDLDLFWQVKTGQIMLHQRALADEETFTSTHAGQSVPQIGWLGQVLLAGLYEIGSWRLTNLVASTVFALGMIVAVLPAIRQGVSLFAVLLGLALGFLVAVPHYDLRPQTFAVLGFALLLWIADGRSRPGWRLCLAAVVLVVWQNLHPSVVLGMAAMAIQAGTRWVRWFRRQEAELPWFPTALALLALAATVATPLGLDIFRISACNTRISRDLAISEWTAWWDPAVFDAKRTAWAALAVSIALLVRVRRRVGLEDLLTLLAFTLLALPMYRLSLFWAVAMVPIWTRWIDQARPASLFPETGRKVVPWPAAAAVTVAALACAVLPAFMRAERFDRKVPLAAAEHLRESGLRGVVYNYREWSGPLIFAGHPQWKVTIDGRLYLFGREEWRRYQEIALGKVPLEQVEEWYHPAAFFLHPDYHARFRPRLEASGRWRRTYADENCVVYLRQAGQGPSLADGFSAGPGHHPVKDVDVHRVAQE